MTGGMERLCYELYLALSQKYHCAVIGPRGGGNFVAGKDTYYECNENSLPWFFFNAALNILRIVCSGQKLYFVIGGSGLIVPLCVFARILSRAKSVIYLHGLDIIVNNNIYQRLFVPLFSYMDHAIVNSNNTRSLALGAGVQEDRLSKIVPGVTKPGSHHSADELLRNEIRELAESDRKKILFVGRLIERKGLVEFCTKIYPKILKNYPESIFLVVGTVPNQALKKDKDYAGTLTKIIRNCNFVKHNVAMLGTVNDTELQYLFEHSDVMVMPLKKVKGDVEGFGIVAIESTFHNLPVVAFNEGGVSDAIIDGITGKLIPPKDYDEFANACSMYLAKGFDPKHKKEREAFLRSVSWNMFRSKILEVLSRL